MNELWSTIPPIKKTSYHLSPQNLEHQDHDIMALIMSIPDEGYYGIDYECT
jgi:hypothetical protein